MFRAAIDIHEQRIAVRRNTKSITAVHARVSQDLRELPFFQNVSIEIDVVDVVEIVAENRFAIAGPFWCSERIGLQLGILHGPKTGAIGVHQADGATHRLS